MSVKGDLLELLKVELQNINAGVDQRTGYPRVPYSYNHNLSGNVFKRFKFLNELDDFPCICFIVGDESRQHVGAGVKYGTLPITIRGYVRTEKPLEAADDLLDDIEHVVMGFSLSNDAQVLGLEESRIVTTSTDEGIMEPFGVAEVGVILRYNV